MKHLKGNQDLQTTLYKQTYLVPDSLKMTQQQTTMELMTYMCSHEGKLIKELLFQQTSHHVHSS